MQAPPSFLRGLLRCSQRDVEAESGCGLLLTSQDPEPRLTDGLQLLDNLPLLTQRTGHTEAWLSCFSLWAVV